VTQLLGLPQLPGIDIEELLWFIARKTGFLRDFTHVLDRYVKHEPDPREILACIVAMGTNMGLRKMALTVELHRLGSPLQDAAVAHLCQLLTDSETLFPTTNLRLIFRQVGSS
jgi:hypothetical protein